MYYQSINGKQDQNLSISNRGLAYGDGVFTTAKVSHGKVQLLFAHIERLIYSCQKLNITLPDVDKISTELTDVAQRFEHSVAKVIITSGQGGRGYSRQGCSSSTVIITFHPFPNNYNVWQKQGINLGVSDFHLGLNPSLAGLKHLNRLEQVLIRRELDQKQADDILVTDINGHIVETSCANLFWLQGNKLYTPDLSNSGVAGLIRQELLNKLPNIQIVKAGLGDIVNAEAMIICNSIMGIVPVRQYQSRKFDINKILNLKNTLMRQIEC